MTILVGYKHNRHYVLAADSLVLADGRVENEQCNKITQFNNFIIASAGDSVSYYELLQMLNHIDHNDDIALQLTDAEFSKKDSDVSGEFLVLTNPNLDKNIISQVTYVRIGTSLSVENVLLENQNLISLGHGAVTFQGAFKALHVWDRGNTLSSIKSWVRQAMFVTAQLCVTCNNDIKMYSYKIKELK